jgi:hypothetical protein
MEDFFYNYAMLSYYLLVYRIGRRKYSDKPDGFTAL